ncbi:LLM class F420-dependent oxidoreductase [Novosphingobium album (ex Liu et al. 2023)]|uniref:LLM class F420-dependent oxidoreductase n=1 Tax=Novosphingobium album (ex Liu et al. 2023) TaxID=3031130 RepID=A0ABT5WUC2_9SPHN|nr:LLM class F420-dependent oxidoreductase [Novosphingobium album (ex Liu et al. 2023)]MDE8653499.1 LLM class F420-dependent oxidoreductase [Novosphingobium album (ex Liu et al. 2023)]
MTFTLSTTLPFDHIQHPDQFVSMEALHECARAVEEAGFTAGTVTDHPVPSARWLDNGGHYAQDPFVMLSMVGAVTTTLKLQTNIIVLPYRNPFITARAVASLDRFTNGRVILGMGAGYLKAEYKALGVDFDSRNDLMDEYIRAMKLAWTGEDFEFEGTGYKALGNRMLPTPVQTPHPPLLVGGNSKRALRRTVELGDAWHPFIVPKAVTDTARTANISGDEDILEAIAYMAEHCEKVGRKEPPKVICSSTFSLVGDWSAQEAIDHFAQLKSLGVSGAGASAFTDSRGEYLDQIRRFGEEVIARIDF